MLILKVYTDSTEMRKAAVKMGTDMDNWVCNYHDMGYPFVDIELVNGIRFEFRTINNLEEAMYYTAAPCYTFVEYHSDIVSQDVKNFILSRIRDPRDYA